MSVLTSINVRVSGISASVPATTVDNEELDHIDQRSIREIIDQVGIRYRHIALEGQTASDLCEVAAQKLLDELSWTPADIGLLVFVSQTPDHIVPGSASQLVARLGLPTHCLALDVNQGCAGYVYGMSVTMSMMQSFGISKGLLLVGDTITKMISDSDNALRTIFSDAGSATAFEFDGSATETKFQFGSSGKDFEAIHVPHGGFRFPTSVSSFEQVSVADGITRSKRHLHMNGQAVFTFGLSTVANSIVKMLDETGNSASTIDQLVLHQANRLLNNSIVRKTGFDANKAPTSLYEHGNTSCATIPVTMVTELRERLRTERLKLMLSGFGVGLSWGNAILETENIVCPKLIVV
ncbi:MAG: hypothetical protein RL266_257 [Bacteroidota bacterium]|jgi:3-oxoacyl-[acyl-carrier-protein] synthase-3